MTSGQELAVDVEAIMSDSRLTFGVTAPGSAAAVAELEAIGVESLWAGGHIASRNPSPEAMIYLALLAANGIEWVALDLAIMAEGLIVVPLYARQSAMELAAMMKDCSPALVCCGDEWLRDGIARTWPDAPAQYLFKEVFSSEPGPATAVPLGEADPVAIIYTSGSSGEAKGVMLNAGNIRHMLGCISGRLDILMEGKSGQDRVFHYLPFVFAGSWMLLLTSLRRGSLLKQVP